tara:strand:- start:246 stop:548 length:303 start_codon:yes stop_codon:yes gene_type:complete
MMYNITHSLFKYLYKSFIFSYLLLKLFTLNHEIFNFIYIHIWLPPTIIPEYKTNLKKEHVSFFSYKECEVYLISKMKEKYKKIKIKSYGSGKYLKNEKST